MSACAAYSIGMQTSRLNELMWFFNMGLGGKDNPLNKKWPVKTLETLLKENNHIDVRFIMLVFSPFYCR